MSYHVNPIEADRGLIVPMTRWETVQFNPTVAGSGLNSGLFRNPSSGPFRKRTAPNVSLDSGDPFRCWTESGAPARACASTRRREHRPTSGEMKTMGNNQCHQCDHAIRGQCSGPRSEGRIRLLINAASAARGGVSRMTLNDWREAEQEIEQRLAHECSKKQR
jgi:hypothetical protein